MATYSTIGSTILSFALTAFLYYFFWVAVLPFMRIEKDNWIYSLFPPIQYAFIVPAVFGFCLFTVVYVFSVYHTGRLITFI